LARQCGGRAVSDTRAVGQASRPAELPRRVLVAILRAYKAFISPALPPACRFTPTCSEYAREAIERYGALRGSWLALRRLARCHPFNPGGVDAVP
jgi:putative membrane protein insertion efficiency factor